MSKMWVNTFVDEMYFLWKWVIDIDERVVEEELYLSKDQQVVKEELRVSDIMRWHEWEYELFISNKIQEDKQGVHHSSFGNEEL